MGCHDDYYLHPVIYLAPNEVIVQVDIYVGDNGGTELELVRGIAFVTNIGETYGPYGTTNERVISVYGAKLLGMFGANAVAIDSIGFYWECADDEGTLYL